ncbi:MAG: hypothetical protein N2C14_21365 [Planctomycetales bacterium]
MSDSQDDQSPREDQLDALLEEYLGDLDSGAEVDRESFLGRWPEFADDLRELLETAEMVDLLAGPRLDSDQPKPSRPARGGELACWRRCPSKPAERNRREARFPKSENPAGRRQDPTAPWLLPRAWVRFPCENERLVVDERRLRTESARRLSTLFTATGELDKCPPARFSLALVKSQGEKLGFEREEPQNRKVG